jgi:hypothetical protein
MNTPITDAAWGRYLSRGQAGENLATPMMKLELDRAALMEALEKIAKNPGDCDSDTGFTSGHIARSALSTARANFPES